MCEELELRCVKAVRNLHSSFIHIPLKWDKKERSSVNISPACMHVDIFDDVCKQARFTKENDNIVMTKELAESKNAISD